MPLDLPPETAMIGLAMAIIDESDQPGSATPQAANAEESVEQRLSRAAEKLRGTLNDVIDSLPIRVKKPAEFQRVLKLDRSLSSRLLRAVTLGDPLAALQRLPGPHGIRLLLKAAEKTKGSRELVSHAESALYELERLVIADVGDWKALEVAIVGWLPDAREQFEMTNRQSAFRAMSNLRGLMAEAEVSVFMIYPSAENPDWVDACGVSVVSRLKRLRPGTPMGLLHGSFISPPPGSTRCSIDGQPIDALHGPPLLHGFCSQPTPQFEVRIDGDTVHYVLKGDGVGIESQVDLYVADVMRGRYPAYKSVDPRPATPGVVIDVPVRTLIVDVLVHEDVWPGVEPELRMYDTVARGFANPTDPARDIDRMDVLESIQNLGRETSRFRNKAVANYLDVIRHVCGRLGWDSDRFRGFRCRVDYPIYGTQLCMVFDPPPRE